jgi:tetratricopeptide (TPR) repeat protein
MQIAYTAYKAKNYSLAIKQYLEAIKLNPDSVKSYTWIAKCYLVQAEYDAAAQAINKALQIDDRDLDARVVANTLAQKMFALAQKKMMTKRYHEAIASFRRILEIKPNSTLSWIGIGEAYRQLGMEGEARAAWREALKYDPENRQLHGLLKTGYYVEKDAKPEPNNLVAISEKAALPPMLADDSLAIVKNEKTNKGTKIESAIKSVVALTKSLGTQIAEKGWQIKKQGNRLIASYVCEQSGGQVESFDWLVDVDTRRAAPSNDNARLLMSRW